MEQIKICNFYYIKFEWPNYNKQLVSHKWMELIIISP